MEIISSTDALAIISSGENYENVEDMTVPDQCLSVTEILERFTSGTYTPEYRQGVYDEDDGENLETDVSVMERPDVDLVDVQEELHNSEMRINQLQETRQRMLSDNEKNASEQSTSEVNKRSEMNGTSTNGASKEPTDKTE